MSQPVSRFAPSPTGLLHLGHAASALQVWSRMAELGGEVLLRIEDIDQTRCLPEYEAAILEDLEWLGFEWPKPVRRQSEHFSEYETALQTLIDRGLCYRCFKTRKDILEEIGRAPHHAPTAYVSEPLPTSDETRLIEQGLPFAWRLNLREAEAALGSTWRELSFTETTLDGPHQVPVDPTMHGDVVLARKDSPTSYHLAATHDDSVQGITHIVRGNDLATSTHVHVLIQALKGWHTPIYSHHSLLTGPDGKRFAKRDKSQTLAALREAGFAPEDVLARAQLA